MSASLEGLRIGLNLLYLVPGAVGGTETYARQLAGALATAHPRTLFLVFCGREAQSSLRAQGWPENVRVIALPVRCANKPARIAAELTLLPAAARRHRVDLLHSLGTTSPLTGACPRVVTIHDLIYDLFPQSFPGPARAGLRLLVPLGARRARRVLADSHATARDIVERLHVPAGRVDVVWLGLGLENSAAATASDVLRERLELGGRRVLLCVSPALPHKNLPALIDALARAGGDAMLVIAGHPGREREALLAHVERLGLGDRVRLTGWISDADLEGLYALADGFVYPSLSEGFGLPILEAMRRSVPVACSNATSLPEVAGDAALLFDPGDSDAIASAMRTLLDGGPQIEQQVARGRARAATFSWAACAERTLASYERALSCDGA